MKYNRTTLINQAVTWLADWNYKVFLQSVNDPHLDDILSENAIDYAYWALAQNDKVGCILPYAIRDKASAYVAIKNIIDDWKSEVDFRVSEAERMVNYYISLSDKGFNRLLNEVTRKAEKRLEIKTDAYWAKKMLEKRELGAAL